MDESLISIMQELGFTATEAKAYIGLLKHSPATGYEIAARTGIPRSAIYSVLTRLETLGAVNAIQDKPAKYMPLPPDRLHAFLDARYSGLLSRMKSGLASLEAQPQPVATWTIQGYDALLDQARLLIRQSETSIIASIWQREARALADDLQGASGRKIENILFSFTPLPDIPGKLFSYGIPEEELGRYWPHKIILISDHHKLLVGSAEQSEANRSVLTDEMTLVEIALSNLVLDITLFGQRQGIQTAEVMTRLARHMAPIDELLAGRLVRA